MRKGICEIILIIGAWAGSSLGLSFEQVAYIPSGLTWSTGYIKGMDINHDGYQDLVFTGSGYYVVYYGYRPYNRYVFEDSIGNPPSAFWDICDQQGDSLLDLLTQREDSSGVGSPDIQIFVPRSYWSFPKVPAWTWRTEYMGNYQQPMYFADLNQDSLKEILTADVQVIYVFDYLGNHQYQKVFSDSIFCADPTGSFAIGDFDGDGRMEFAVPTYGSSDTTVLVYKCTGINQYQRVWGTHLETANMYDCISLPNIKGNGKTDFMIGSLRTGPSPWAGCLWIYESTGINQYSVIYSDSILGVGNRGVYCVHSACGDLLRDGKQELVWAIDRDWMVYKYDGKQFQRIFRAYGDNGKNSTNVYIHDMNGNGYPEIIESGGNETHIWEVETCRLLYPNGGEALYADSQCIIRWLNVDPFKADSFSLFFSSDSGYTYTPIAHGIPGSDSTYSWTVNDTVSTRCFIMLWAYQNATGWDFSDGPFAVRKPNGVEASSVIPLSPGPLVPLSVVPNPFVSYARTPGYEGERFALYDVSGRKVGVFKGDRIGEGLAAGIYFLKPEGKDTKPLRIVKLR